MGRFAGIDPELNHADDHERERGYEQADPNFAQRRQREELLNPGINQVRKERQHRQDEDRIHGLNLGGQPLDSEQVPVHLLRLQNP